MEDSKVVKGVKMDISSLIYNISKKCISTDALLEIEDLVLDLQEAIYTKKVKNEKE